MNKDVKVFLNFRRLRHIQRCNNFARVMSEDDAQHSYFTTMLAMIIADEYNAKNDELVNTELVIRKALMHDTDEVVTGDIPFNVKHADKQLNTSLAKVMSTIVQKLYEGSSTQFQKYRVVADTCKQGIEGSIVDLADMLELAVYCHEEVNAGNDNMNSLLKRAITICKERNTNINSDFVKTLLDYISNKPKDIYEI